MAEPVLVIGRSGSGKTFSLKNFNPKEVGVISVEKNRLPFKSDIKVVKVKKFDNTDASPAQLSLARYQWIKLMIKESKAKSIVIDDSQYLLANELFDRANEKGYDKFTGMAANFRDLIHFINELDYVKNYLEFPCIYAIIKEENRISKGVLRKFGFEYKELCEKSDGNVSVYRKDFTEDNKEQQ